MNKVSGFGMGWLPDYPDFRDYTQEHREIEDMFARRKSKVLKGIKKISLPSSVDLRPWCSPIENQRNLGSCTAHAGIGLVEYFEKRAFGRHLDASRLFLYKVTRNLLQWTGDSGAFLRTTMKALVIFGVPPEEYWPYVIEDFDKEPPAFCYSFAQMYQTIKYYRLDLPGIPGDKLLTRIKLYLASGYPPMFGFTVYSSIHQAKTNGGKIPYPEVGERVLGGHAVTAVGYDDGMKIKNDRGALLIRNSWGTDWGDKGYGWLPYKYVESGLATDFWSILKQEWLDTEVFE